MFEVAEANSTMPHNPMREFALSGPAAVGLALISIAAVPAEARNLSPTTAGELGTCQRAVSRIGPQFGYTEHKTESGDRHYSFTVRTDNGNYRVVCDGATGSLGDVERIVTTSDGGTR